ncbi:MAG: FlgD immunoglobulin-like domain containing protein [Bacteroidota bacterium]|nr:FlgD immunoglobulin-like domain containing protein [Bacteroidota bacterium]MDP4232531.1 FlgD immunoglobulin-like domain containing protein [Bacteroidota bacterium]MDP4286411.1 FlgD immunoglobulin-like domain containing protein [Bacteroidota bacterium]
MHRFLTLRATLRVAYVTLLVAAGLVLAQSQSHAQYFKRISGYLTPGNTNVFYPRVPGNSLRDTIYEIAGTYNVSGTLTIMEGAEVHFLPNGRVIDSSCGVIRADGFTGLNRRILFRGIPINQNSYEWGHFLILPGANAYFANCRFVNFRKRTLVDTTLIYGGAPGSQAYTNSVAINNAANGVGGVICTFARNTYLYDIIVDSCQASFRGGAFAFLQQPANFVDPTNCVPNDDGRLALVASPTPQVQKLVIRDTRVYNNEVVRTAPPANNITDVVALGGAIYIASNTNAISSANFVTGRLGYDTNGVVAQTSDNILIERCSATNALTGANEVAKGGGIYVGSNSALYISSATFNNDSAIAASADYNAWGGGIAVSASSGPQGTNSVPTTLADRAPGLTIYKTANFNTCVAGLGGAVMLDCPAGAGGPSLVRGPVLNIDGEHWVPAGAQSAEYPLGFTAGSTIPYRDSGLIIFQNNVANVDGGAIYTSYHTFVNGYLAPQNFPWPGGNRPVELRVKFLNNVAAVGGGSIFINDNGYGPYTVPGGVAVTQTGPGILSNHRVWHQGNSVNAYDPRVLPTKSLAQRSTIAQSALGGGAEWLGMTDSTYATEYNSNLVIGGNGGAVAMVGQVSNNQIAVINRYFVEEGYQIGKPNQSPIPSDPRQLTRFLNNQCYMGADSTAEVGSYINSGGQTSHARGGGIYLKITNPQTLFVQYDSTFLSRVRLEQNTAFTGSAIFSDNFDLRFITNLCLIANNLSTSKAVADTDLDATGISNPYNLNSGATIWAEFEGTLPSYNAASRNDAIYDNVGRYILRLPVSQIQGLGGTDTMRGLFWGETGPNVITQINPPNGAEQSTFFIDYFNGCFGKEIIPPQPPPYGVYEPNSNPSQGYAPPPIGLLPDTTLMEGRVYDVYDLGTSMRVADYNNRRMAPSEDIALGLPNDLMRMHRYTRNIFDLDPVYVSKIDPNQTDFVGPHPLGYPLFLQADVSAADSNRDAYAKNYTTFFVINQTTNEFVRVNLKETMVDEGNGPQQIYQGRLDFVPDSSIAKRHAAARATTNWSLSLLRPSPTSDFNEIQRASVLEDAAALDGREYPLQLSDLQDTANHDTVCTEGMNGTTYWFAGERYHTLPVRPGDHIAVVSRTQLWKWGAAYALTNGLRFVIGDVLAPQFVTDIPNLQADPYNPNIKFVHEDDTLDGRDANHTLFRVGGWDANNFYDPRFLFNPGNYTQLAFNVTYDVKDTLQKYYGTSNTPLTVGDTSGIRLFRWLKQTTIFNQNITGSNGYVLLWGTPHNPDVVPGGEALTATVTNWPPNYASEHNLLSAFPGGTLGADSLALSMWTFPRYMNWNTGSCPQPGFEPDTLCVHSTSSTYHFRIIVMDSLPRFLSTPPARCFASLTDSLRFIYDVNTDDESEDSIAATEASQTVLVNGKKTTIPGWDFRYGKTTYKFLSRPIWMQRSLNPFTHPNNYGTVDTDQQFINQGKIYVAVDSAWAVQQLLTPTPQVNGELNFDTTISVEANDGHTGKSLQRWAVTVNLAPAITTSLLPPAKEGIDYSLNFTDTSKVNRIKIFDPNFADYHTYKLLYKGQSDSEYRDPNYHVGGALLNGTTPGWLHIDQYSGVLTGVPGDTDAPRTGITSCGGEDTVLVIVQDECGLTTWAWLPIEVDSTQHIPGFVRGPKQVCIWNGVQYCDSLKVFDRDLLRPGCLEYDTVTSLTPGVTVNGGTTPAILHGQLQGDTLPITWCYTPNHDQKYFNTPNPIPDTVKFAVVDVAGNTDTIAFPVHVGDLPTFNCAVWVSNPQVTDPVSGAITHPIDLQKLVFGTGQYGTDSLDARYCEVEIPPQPQQSVFDARWVLPTGGQLEGTQIDIRRDLDKGATNSVAWQVKFTAGNENGNNLYPVEICWSSACARAALSTTNLSGSHLFLRNPQNSSKFSIDMSTGLGPIDPTLYTLTTGSDTMCLSIRDVNLSNALIVLQPSSSGVSDNDNVAPSFALEPNHPNPFTSATTIDFKVAQRSSVRIDIFDLKGTLVRTLVSETLDPGSYPVTWDGTDATGHMMASGTYIATMTAGSFTSSVKMSHEAAE